MMMITLKFATTLLLSLLLGGLLAFQVGASGGDRGGGGDRTTVVDIAIGTGVHTTLVALLLQADLADVLDGRGPWTVFAPVDDAFAALPPEAGRYTMPRWSEHLVDILLYHVVNDELFIDDLTFNADLTMANGETTRITRLGLPRINSATIAPADVHADNGVVHVIDDVLLPTSITTNIVEFALGADDFSTLVELVVAAELVDTLSNGVPLTVFAPTNAAFEALFASLSPMVVEYLKSEEGRDDLVKILTYHVFPDVIYRSDISDREITMVSGDEATLEDYSPMINQANILDGQIKASNGVILPIDAVILPDSLSLPNPSDIVTIVSDVDDFDTLVALVAAADLVETLSGDGPFTLFAPTNDAFSALPSIVVQYLLSEEGKDDLTKILTYHVFPEAILGITEDRPLTMVSGDEAMLKADPPMIDDANVITGIRLASNGVIRAIDSVILPSSLMLPDFGTIVDVAIGVDDFSTLVNLVVVAGLVDTLSGDGPFTVFAPTNDAFEALFGVLGSTLVEYLISPEGQDDLINVLTYHVFPGEIVQSDIPTGDIRMVNGDKAMIKADPPMIDQANILPIQLFGTNGIIHAIDAVLIPDSLSLPIFPSILEIAAGVPGFSTLVSLVGVAGLVDALSGDGPFTVFAPTNDAFAALDSTVVQYLISPAGKDDLIKILSYHVFPGEIFQSDIPTGEITMLSEDVAMIMADPAMIDDADILPGQSLASNGVIHSINSVLLPMSLMLPDFGNLVVVAAGVEDFSILVGLVVTAGLAETLARDGPFTVFAPTNAAFEYLFASLGPVLVEYLGSPEGRDDLVRILTYHVFAGEIFQTDIPDETIMMVSGDEARLRGDRDPPKIEDAKILPGQVLAENGVIHGIDEVIIPDNFNLPTFPSILDVASGAPDFSTLVALLANAADLISSLSGAGLFTVFAPTNDAFEALDPALVAYLTSPEGIDDLIRILAYHVFVGFLSDIADGEITMLSGDVATLKADPPMIDEANILSGQSFGSNGVILTIDSVLVPDSITLPDLSLLNPRTCPECAGRRVLVRSCTWNGSEERTWACAESDADSDCEFESVSLTCSGCNDKGDGFKCCNCE